jgi:cell division protein FtsZ
MKGAKGVIISITGGEDMRLMEVDEAANHIKDLVDPDANIIWGSAFNNDLDGKIRVSVVATGIDVEEATQAPPLQAKVFAFPAGRAAEPPRVEVHHAPTRPAPEAAPADPEPMVSAPRITLTPPEPMAEDTEMGEEDEEPVSFIDEPTEAPSELALTPPDEEEGDELLLDTVDFEADEPPAADDETDPPAGHRRTWLTQETGAEPAAKPSPREGGTLFERMSNIARGAAKAQVDEEETGARATRDPLDIPRFLNRQNNQ